MSSVEASVMTAEQFKALRARLAAALGRDVTQEDLAHKMGMSRTAIARCEGGDAEIPERTARHLRLLVEAAERRIAEALR